MPTAAKRQRSIARKCSAGGAKLRLKGLSKRARSEGGSELVRCRSSRPVAGGLYKGKKPAKKKPAPKRKSVKNGRNGLNAKEAYDAGRDEGYNAAVYGEFEPGATRDDMASEAFEIESNARQYAGHPTYEIESDAAWEAYDRGVGVGIKKGLAERFGKPRKTKHAR